MVAAVVGAMALVALVLPSEARPMVSLVVALVLAAVAFIAVRRHRGIVAGHEMSPFDRHVGRMPEELPTELGALVHMAEAAGIDQPIPEMFADRLRRCSMRRLRERHGADLRVEREWKHVSTMVSPELYRLLTGDTENLTSRAVPQLVEEVEGL